MISSQNGQFYVLYSKNFDDKKVWWIGCCKGLSKKLWWMLTCIANHWLTVKQSRTKLSQTSMSIIKQTLYFPGFVLCHMPVVYCLMMARCTVESMICGYHEYISKLLIESELDLLKYCNINILTSILMQNKLKCTSCCCVHLMLQKQENWQKRTLVNWKWFAKVFTVRYFTCLPRRLTQ